jgi:uncharacterized FlaG/YvyC family protein
MITPSVGPAEPVVSQPSTPVYSDNKAAEVQTQTRVAAVQASAQAVEQAQAKPNATPTPASKASSTSPLDINLRFRVDQKTKDVTVFMLNQATHEVIRTIPPSELAKLKPGDLVNLFA